VHVLGLLTEPEATRFRGAALAAIQERCRKDESFGTGIVSTTDAWEHNAILREFALHPRIGATAQRLAGMPLRVWGGEVLVKYPHESATTGLHDDLTFALLDSRLTFNAWIALVDVPVERGCLTFLPRSHRREGPERVELSEQLANPDADLFTHRPQLQFSPRSPFRCEPATRPSTTTAPHTAPAPTPPIRLGSRSCSPSPTRTPPTARCPATIPSTSNPAKRCPTSAIPGSVHEPPEGSTMDTGVDTVDRRLDTQIDKLVDAVLGSVTSQRITTMPASARAVHRTILRTFADTGTAPTRAQLGDDPSLDRSLETLAAHDMIGPDDTGHRGEIAYAYPFSTRPTDSWQPAGAVVFLGSRTDCCTTTSAQSCCGYLNFFASHRDALAWSAEHPEIHGVVLDQHQALKVGGRCFGDLLQTQTAQPASG
jgi:phytanoyl-CoA hydroxylase